MELCPKVKIAVYTKVVGEDEDLPSLAGVRVIDSDDWLIPHVRVLAYDQNEKERAIFIVISRGWITDFFSGHPDLKAAQILFELRGGEE